MKAPSEDNVKMLVIVAGALAAAYLVYKLYGASNAITQSIGETFDKLKTSAQVLGDSVAIDTQKVRTSLGGASPSPVEDQSDAETARLGRQNGPQTGWFGDNILNMYSSSYAKAQVESPDAVGSTATYDAMGNYTGEAP